MYTTDFGCLWEKASVGCSEKIELKQVYYQWWNRSPAQVGCMRQVLRAGALGRPRGMGWRGSWEVGSEWRTHVNPWLIHVNVWQKSLQYCKVISVQLIKINEKKLRKNKTNNGMFNVFPEVSETVLISFLSFFFILFLGSFHHSIFQFAYSFFCLNCSAIDSF